MHLFACITVCLLEAGCMGLVGAFQNPNIQKLIIQFVRLCVVPDKQFVDLL